MLCDFRTFFINVTYLYTPGGKMSDSTQGARCADERACMCTAASGPLQTGARARAVRECMSVPDSTNVGLARAFAADIRAVG